MSKADFPVRAIPFAARARANVNIRNCVVAVKHARLAGEGLAP